MVLKRLLQTAIGVVTLIAAVILPQTVAMAVGEVYGPYYLVDVNSGLCIDNPNSNPNNNVTMTIYNCLGGNNQKWNNETSGKCLTVQNARPDDNAAVLQFTCNSGTNERWTYQSANPDNDLFVATIGGQKRITQKLFKIKNLNSGRCLTVKNASRNSGATLLQFDCTKAGSNVWAQFPV
jgi:ricin-type beta-trefoil lectin protein